MCTTYSYSVLVGNVEMWSLFAAAVYALCSRGTAVDDAPAYVDVLGNASQVCSGAQIVVTRKSILVFGA